MDESTIFELLNNMYNSLDDKPDYFETRQCLSSHAIVLNEDRIDLDCDNYILASELIQCDKNLPMDEQVAQFCMQILFDEYTKGNADAACDLGALYYLGRPVEQDFTKALEYYTFASEHGSRQATENLGYCYYYGRGTEKNYEKAYHYFIKGALDGHLISLYKIADMYRYGHYVEKDEKECYIILDHCLSTIGSEETENICGADIAMRLAECYHYGIGTEINYDLALRLYQMSEALFYKRLKEGDELIRNNLKKVLKEEAEVQKLIQDELEL